MAEKCLHKRKQREKKPKHKLGNRTNRWSKMQADSRCTSSKKQLKQRKTYPRGIQSEYNHTYGLKSSRCTAAKIWDALPDQFRAANNIGTFKNLMSKMDFSNFNKNT